MSLEKAHMPLTVKQIAIMDKAEKFDRSEERRVGKECL